jgi:CRP-like cAMP-binding protein
METLRKLLDAECDYRMKDETMDKFPGSMTEIELKRNEPLIPYGKFDSNVYVVRTGILRAAYFDGFKEMTFAFGLPGSVAISYYSFCKDNPSFSKLEACCDSVIMKITKPKFTELIKQSHDFAQWMLSMSLEQLLFHEKKREVVNGDAKERFESLMKNRPEIIKNVPSKIVASYIGISPEYLSRLKKRFMLESKE